MTTPDYRQQILALWEEGLTPLIIASRLDLSLSSVSRVVRSAQEAKAHALVEQGLTLRDVAKALGVSVNTVRRYLSPEHRAADNARFRERYQSDPEYRARKQLQARESQRLTS